MYRRIYTSYNINALVLPSAVFTPLRLLRRHLPLNLGGGRVGVKMSLGIEIFF
jgi:hypothetical protein